MRETTNSAAFGEMSIPTHRPLQPVCCHQCRGTSTEGVKHNIAGAATGFDDAVKERQWASVWDSRYVRFSQYCLRVKNYSHLPAYVLGMAAIDIFFHRGLGVSPLSGQYR